MGTAFLLLKTTFFYTQKRNACISKYFFNLPITVSLYTIIHYFCLFLLKSVAIW
nr:MAG TPA_asm: hypothetical protein [Caudoviricetes sp.]